MPTPFGAPDFAQAFGLQVNVLAKDGVQHAELHLNPAEMGPVSVQITVDGTQARIDFGADVLATRQAIEAGLPELASALRDAGFTLHGGGVSQHRTRREDAVRLPARRRRPAEGPGETESTRPLAARAARAVAPAASTSTPEPKAASSGVAAGGQRRRAARSIARGASHAGKVPLIPACADPFVSIISFMPRCRALRAVVPVRSRTEGKPMSAAAADPADRRRRRAAKGGKKKLHRSIVVAAARASCRRRRRRRSSC